MYRKKNTTRHLFAGVTCIDGPTWNIQRNFVVKHLRDLGFGKSKMETMVKDEFSVIKNILSEQTNKIRIGRILTPSILNVLWTLTTGSRLLRDNPKLINLIELFNKRSKAFDMSGGTLSQMPWLRFFAPEKTGFNLLKKINSELKSLFMKVIEQHHNDWSENRDDDLIYAYITEMRKEKKHSSFTCKLFWRFSIEKQY